MSRLAALFLTPKRRISNDETQFAQIDQFNWLSPFIHSGSSPPCEYSEICPVVWFNSETFRH